MIVVVWMILFFMVVMLSGCCLLFVLGMYICCEGNVWYVFVWSCWCRYRRFFFNVVLYIFYIIWLMFVDVFFFNDRKFVCRILMLMWCRSVVSFFFLFLLIVFCMWFCVCDMVFWFCVWIMFCIIVFFLVLFFFFISFVMVDVVLFVGFFGIMSEFDFFGLCIMVYGF